MPRPSGTVTLLFTDIEGSTRMWDAHPDEMQIALARHDLLLRGAIEAGNGYVFKTVGDAFSAAFPTASEAVLAAVAAQRAIGAEAWPTATQVRVRMGLHSGTCEERDGDYFGTVVNRAARLEALAHGGQTVVSGLTAELARDSLPDDVTLVDLGEHRLKDLGRVEHVFQLRAPGLEDDFAPLRSLDNPALLHNLPAQVSTFVGREREVAELRQLVEGSRLVTVTGSGGAGKTRLALQVAADLVDGSGDGVWFVDLAPLADPDLLAATICAVLGLREQAGRPMLESLIDALADQRALLILDNCEHVVDAAAKAAHAILGSCPRMHLLATSREGLGIGGEQVYRVPSLQVPDADEADPSVLLASDAVRLFAERVAQHRAGYTLDPADAPTIARLCRRLDGIPLAIELAAARVRSLSLDELEARLDERFRLLTGGARTALPRQQTLRALIDWSWDLLTEAEQTVLARVSVFAGGWDLDAAEAVVCGTDIEAWEVLDLLSALVDKSLAQTDETVRTVRYRLLESVREYANAKLEAREGADTVTLRAAHRDHYLALAETAAPHLIAHAQVEWLDRLELELDNLRAALVFSLTDVDTEPGIRLAIALQWFWQSRGPAAEGAEILTELLDGSSDDTLAGPLRRRALAALAVLLIEFGESQVAVARCDEALAIGRAEGDDDLCALALSALAYTCLRQGKLADGLALADDGLASARRVGNVDLTARLLNTRGIALGETGDTVASQACYQEARVLCVETGNRIFETAVLNNLGSVALLTGDIEAARPVLREALSLANEIHDRTSSSVMLNLGLVEFAADSYPAARDLFGQALSIPRRAGDHRSVAYAIFGLALTTGGGPERAATLHGGADARLEALGEIFEVYEADLRDANQARLRETLGAPEFERAYQAGRDLGRDEAIGLALESAAGNGKLAR